MQTCILCSVPPATFFIPKCSILSQIKIPSLATELVVIPNVSDNLNVIPVLVSATFLQMDPLIHECISYFKANMDDVIRTASPNLSCLNDAVIAK